MSAVAYLSPTYCHHSKSSNIVTSMLYVEYVVLGRESGSEGGVLALEGRLAEEYFCYTLIQFKI